MKELSDFFAAYEVDQTQPLDPNGGSVYPATERSTGTTYAAKWSETHPKFDRQLLPERYTNARALDHPNLLPYQANFRFGGQTITDVLLLPFITEKSLAQHHDLTEEEKRSILEQVLDALHYLHAQGLVWQQLAASHILLEQHFGNWIPRLIHYGNQQRIPVAYFSDWEYLAPEQFEAEAKLDARTDVWAFGVLVYELWTGRLPFGKKSASLTNETIKGRITGTADWALGLMDQIPMPYRMIAEKCLKRDLDARWTNCGQIIVALQEWMPDPDAVAPPTTDQKETVPTPQRFARRAPSRIVWWQVPFWLLLAGLLGYWLGQLG